MIRMQMYSGDSGVAFYLLLRERLTDGNVRTYWEEEE